MAEFPLPIYGLNEAMSRPHQPVGTSPDVLNTRPQDPITGREGIAQRAGMEDITGATAAQVNGSNKVQHIAGVTFSQNSSDYAEISDANLVASSEWTAELGARARHVVRDRQNATYWIVGRDMLVKLNASGEEVWRFTVPLKEETHQARGLAVDGIGNLWVTSDANQDLSDASFDAVSVDAVQENVTIFRIGQITNEQLDEEARVTGEWTAAGFVPDIAVRFGFVYYLQNRADAYEADLVVLSGFGVDEVVPLSQPASPVQIALRGVPYPANSLAVNSDGEIVVASEPFNDRLVNPKYPGLSRVSNTTKLPGMWTFRRNLSGVAGKLWCEINPAILGQANGTLVTTLPDSDGYGRGFKFASSLAGDTRTFTEPTYIERALGDAPGVRFDGVDNGLQSESNASLDYRDRGGAQRTPWPSYGSHTGSPKVADSTCAMFCLFMVVRLPRVAAKGAIIGQRSDAANEVPSAGLVRNTFSLVANRPEDQLTTVAAEAGKITLYDFIRETAGDFQSNLTPTGPLAGAGDVRFVREADLLGVRAAPNDSADPEEPPIALITLMIDNGVDPGGLPTAKTRSMLRVNGRPIDRWEGSIRISEHPVTLGFSAESPTDTLGANHGFLDGDFVRYVCFARPDPADTTQLHVLTHQATSPRAVVLNLLGTATSGQFTITFHYPDGTADETTANLNFNATAAQVETALEALGSLVAADISVAGTAINVGGGVNVFIGWDESTAKPTDTGEYYGVDVPTFTVNDVSLAGGTVSATRAAEIDSGLSGTTVAHTVLKDKEVELIEGQIAHEFGFQHLFPQAGEPFEHPFALYPPLDPEAVDPTDLLSTNAILSKYSTGALALKWVYTDRGGVGYGVTLDSDDNIYSVGPQQTSPSDAVEIRRIVDDGDSVTFSWSAAFNDAGFGDRHVRMATDEDDSVYVPRYRGSAGNSAETVIVYDVAGATELLYDNSATAANIVPAYAVALPRARPDYGPGSSIDRDEFLWIATDQTATGGGADDTGVARKVRLVSVTANSNPPRDTRVYAVAGGTVKFYNGSTYAAMGVEETGDDTLDSASTYLSSCELFGKRYLTDGVGEVREIAPFEVPTATGLVRTLKAADGGEMPMGVTHLAGWRGRLIFGGKADNPHFWKMAQIGKVDHVNEFSAVPFVGQAISGANSPEAGESPDTINALYPWTEDWLIFGGDHSINAMIGDPTAQGVVARGDIPSTVGQFVTITDSTGIAFGQAITRDRKDTAYFMSPRAEVYAMAPRGRPQPLSDRAVAQSLSLIDFSTHWIKATWNWYDDTVHFWVIPFGSATVETHYVLDVKRAKIVQADGGDLVSLGWWRDRFGHADVQPTAIAIVDADEPDDRRMLVGCADGRIRRWSPSAKNDDLNDSGSKVAIDAYADLWYTPRGMDSQWMFNRLQLDLAGTQNGCLVEQFGTDEADAFPAAEQVFALSPGWNPPLMDRVVGNYCKVRVRNAAVDERMFVERASVMASRAGDRRMRT